MLQDVSYKTDNLSEQSSHLSGAIIIRNKRKAVKLNISMSYGVIGGDLHVRKTFCSKHPQRIKDSLSQTAFLSQATVFVCHV